jgi:hypothetical protein
MSDGIRRIADAVRNHDPRARRRQSKTNRMLALTEPQFSRFQAYCKAKRIFASEVVDVLIAEFLREADADVRAVLGESPPDAGQLPPSDGGGAA